MRHETNAALILDRMLDRHERRTSERRVIERPGQSFRSAEELRSFIENLEEAQRNGAVDLVWDREAPHLVGQVVLADPARLYAFVGRPLPKDALAAGVDRLAIARPATEQAKGLVQDLIDAWSRFEKVVGLGSADVDEAMALVRALDAAFTDLGETVPLRTRSARLLNDSKALERALPLILGYLRRAGLIEPNQSKDAALESFGLTKFAQPVLIAGPVAFAGLDVSALPYAGVPPEVITSAKTLGHVRSVLTIENLESFNRHVRMCRRPDDLVVYTGGFPSSAVMSLLRIIVVQLGCALHHWGDVDPGGVRIGRHLETALGVQVVPHLMTVDLVGARGRPREANQIAPALPSGSAFFKLSEYLRSPDALWLEQEVIDPVAVTLR